ncbi:MAG: RecQ family ATP-dependent DNA helicase [Flavobacteriaceae bacterium]
MISPQDILLKYWGYNSFRASQEAIIDKVLENKDVLALLPTGGGKSLCYQVPALAREGICLVISPLISLMKDQIENLDSKGIKASTIKSKSSIDDIVALFDNLKYGYSKFLYLSPERLQSEFILQKIKEIPINLIAIDEAHCISEWGHDFRPSYRHIKKIREIVPDVTMIALTATATKKVIEDIVTNLALKNVSVFKKSFYRDNLAYQIFTHENKLGRLEQIFKKNPFPTIVYVNSRRKTEEISNFITSKGFSSTFYHGGMSAEYKSKAFEEWMKEEKIIMVATNSFGMGIDKPNVKIVIHLDLPNSIENYVQEAGRGGRNGEKSFSVVLQNENDILSYKRNTLENIPTVKEIKEVHQKLYQYFQVAKGEKPVTTFDFNFLAFCQLYKLEQKKTSNIIQILKKNEIIDVNPKFYQKSTILFTTTSKQLIHYKFNSKLSKKLVDFLLRSFGGVFQKETKINEFDIAKRLQTNSTIIKEELKKLEESNLILYKETNSDEEFVFLVPREDDITINRVSKTIQSYLTQQIKKSEDLISFIKNDTICRSIQLLNYFGETAVSDCGMCDVCIIKKNENPKDLDHQIIQLFKNRKEISQEEIITLLPTYEKAILIHLRKLVSKDIIGITNDNKFFLL